VTFPGESRVKADVVVARIAPNASKKLRKGDLAMLTEARGTSKGGPRAEFAPGRSSVPRTDCIPGGNYRAKVSRCNTFSDAV